MTDDRMQWFREGKYGMLITWGLYSQLGMGECEMWYAQIPAAEYAPLADRFFPRPGFAGRWAQLARRAGMRYVVFVTKHVDGFCHFDTALTDYNATRHGARRDYTREVVEAFRAEGLRIGLYYCPYDFYHGSHGGPWYLTHGEPPKLTEAQKEARQQFFNGQIRELLSNYGKVDLLWIDGAPPVADTAAFRAACRAIQPELVFCDRAHGGDYASCEHTFTPAPFGKDWEMCETINDLWGYGAHDYNYKTVNQLIFHLVNCAVQGGNLLLNIGPRADGSVPDEQVKRLEAVGRWLEVHGEAVYGVERLATPYFNCGRVTRKGRRLYLHAFYWPGERMTVVNLTDETLRAPVGKARLSARILTTGEPATTRWDGTRLIVEGLPANPPDQADTVIVVEPA